MGMIEEVRLLPEEVPRDQLHAMVLTEILERKLGPVEAMEMFRVPEHGVHNTMYWLSMHWLAWARAGRHVLKLDPRLQNALAKTSLDGVEPGDIKLPHNSIWVAFPGEGLKVWGGERTLWHRAVGAWVNVTKGERTGQDPTTGEWLTTKVAGEDPGALNFLLWGEENGRSENEGDDAVVWWTLDLKEVQESDLDLEAYLLEHLTDETKDEPINEVSSMFGSRTAPPKGSIRRVHSQEMAKCARVIVNALLYACTKERALEEDAESVIRFEKREAWEQRASRAKSPGKKKRYLQKREQVRATRIWNLGLSSPAGGISKDAGPHWVRGHWWPNKANIRKRVSAARSTTSQIRTELQAERQSLAEGSAWPASKTAQKLGDVVSLRRLLREAEDREQTLAENLSKKLRWVAPYERNKETGEE